MAGQKTSKKVAVIGAGAAGLVSARELRREGHSVVVFEQAAELGGTWVYTDQVESDPLSKDPDRLRVHSSMYRGLTTNLPRGVMGFSDLPFSPAAMGMRMGAAASMDARRFPCSEEVLRYLQVFAEHFQLHSLVRFNSQVVKVEPLPCPVDSTAAAAACGDSGSGGSSSSGWQVSWRDLSACSDSKQQQNGTTATATASTPALPSNSQQHDHMHSEVFDAVLVANGHYTEPHLPDIPGAAAFPGLLLHSHNYRRPERFKGQHVAVVGASYSGLDIARLVSQQAACVYVSAREWRTPGDIAPPAVRGCSNIQRRGMITRLTAAGGADFTVGAAVPQLDAVILCTGYTYNFEFLDLKALGLSTAQQHVSPLYQHMFPVAAAPSSSNLARYSPTSLAFIGLPWRIVPFPLFELQAKLCARLLSGRASLPPAEEMSAWVQQHEQQLEAEGLRPEHSHCLDYRQMHYHAWLAQQCGPDVSVLPNWRAYVLHGIWLARWLYVAVTRCWRRWRAAASSQSSAATAVAAATARKQD